MKYFLSSILLLFVSFIFAQEKKYSDEEISISPLVEGVLLNPSNSDSVPLAILIGGSGPIDRDGNQMMAKNNHLRFLAEGLYEQGLATFRYDKRLIKLIERRNLDEKNIRFDHFIDDAVLILEHFKNDNRFSKIFVIGHSQGSLVGMVAARGRADGFISIAGAGQEIDDVIVEQIEKQAPGLKDNARQSFDDLREYGVTQNYSQGLASIFRPAIQPFMLNWMQYDPQKEIAELSIPVLVINGDRDLQVLTSEAEALMVAKPDAQLRIIINMNHVLKEIKGDDLDNQKSYNEYSRPVMPELIETISRFILN